MRLRSDVMLASDSSAFLDAIGCPLQDEGALVVCVESVNDASQALNGGFRPEVLVIDGAMRSGPDLIARLRAAPECKLIPVIVAAPVRALDELPSRGVMIVRRYDAVVEAIQGLYFGSA